VSTALLILCCWAVLVQFGGCGDEHSRLAKEDAGIGGQATTTTSGTTGGAGGGGGSTAAGGKGGDPEPSGPTTVTVVNGVVDEDAVRLCFMTYPGGTGAEPWPASGGLGFARPGRIDPITPTVPAGSDVQVYVIGGDLTQTTGQTCAEVLAAGGSADAGAALRIRSAGVVPAGVFESERSLLVALYGCAGAPGHEHASAESICGSGYAPTTGNVAMAVGFLSRQVHPSRVGMQFVHASGGTPSCYLRVAPGIDGAVADMAANGWSLGAIAPYPPYWRYARTALGTVNEATLELSIELATVADRTSFADALANSTLEEGDLVDGLGFTFVMVGAAPTIPPQSGDWWHGLSYTVVPSSP
jgi:hypothetical protein